MIEQCMLPSLEVVAADFRAVLREGTMWVRMTTFEGGSAEQFDEGMRYIEEHVLPPLRAMAGFQGVLNLSTADRSAGVTLTFWESEQALQESEDAANRLRGEAADAGGDAIAGVERYEVVMDETTGERRSASRRRSHELPDQTAILVRGSSERTLAQPCALL